MFHSRILVALLNHAKSQIKFTKPKVSLRTRAALTTLKPAPILLGYAWAKKESNDTDNNVGEKERLRRVEWLAQKADSLYAQNKYQEVLKLLQDYKNSDEVELLWRLSRVKYNLSQEASTPLEEKKALIAEAYRLIQRSLELNDDHFANHKWMSILLDSHSQNEGLKVRITNLETVKSHMLKAVELNNNDATTLYMLGVWCFEIANMPWYQRKIASTIFASPPNSSFEEALGFFLKAEEVEPRFYSRNLLMLGKTYLSLGKEDKARYYLDLASNYPANTDEDHLASKEAFDLLKKMKPTKT